MRKEETINDLNGRLCNIANESFGLGEKIREEKLVKKALRSLSSRFAYKAIVVTEAKDLNIMRLEELMGSIRTFEIDLNKEANERKKLVGLRAESKLLSDESDELFESMALLSKNFERAIDELKSHLFLIHFSV